MATLTNSSAQPTIHTTANFDKDLLSLSQQSYNIGKDYTPTRLVLLAVSQTIASIACIIFSMLEPGIFLGISALATLYSSIKLDLYIRKIQDTVSDMNSPLPDHKEIKNIYFKQIENYEKQIKADKKTLDDLKADLTKCEELVKEYTTHFNVKLSNAEAASIA